MLLSLFEFSGANPAVRIAHLGDALLAYAHVKKLYDDSRLRQCWDRLWGARRLLKVSYGNPSAADKGKANAAVDRTHLECISDKIATSDYASRELSRIY